MAYVELYPHTPVEQEPETDQQECTGQEFTPPVYEIIANRTVGREVLKYYRLITDADFNASRDRHLNEPHSEHFE